MPTKKKKRSRARAISAEPAPRNIRRKFPEVTKIIDADGPIQVRVTPADCDGATTQDPNHCALARAAMREYRADAAIIGMSTSYLIFSKKKLAVRYQTSQAVQRELVSFDRHHDFEPGSYIMQPKRPSRRFGADAYTRHDPRPRHDAEQRGQTVHHTARVRTLMHN